MFSGLFGNGQPICVFVPGEDHLSHFRLPTLCVRLRLHGLFSNKFDKFIGVILVSSPLGSCLNDNGTAGAYICLVPSL